MRNSLELGGKVASVTGAAHGLGAEIASPLVESFLASDAASYVSGAEITVDCAVSA
jgi:NAD(P)-dependent dehydrogenase (short-subunit alcohol dehydrogenase family)